MLKLEPKILRLSIYLVLLIMSKNSTFRSNHLVIVAYDYNNVALPYTHTTF
jgi:hypothetical protein